MIPTSVCQFTDHLSASFSLLLIPSSVFLNIQLLHFSPVSGDSFTFSNSCEKCLNCSLCFFLLFLSSLIVFMIITLNSFWGRLPVSASLRSPGLCLLLVGKQGTALSIFVCFCSDCAGSLLRHAWAFSRCSVWASPAVSQGLSCQPGSDPALEGRVSPARPLGRSDLGFHRVPLCEHAALPPHLPHLLF